MKDKKDIFSKLIWLFPILAFLVLLVINIAWGQNWINSDMSAELIFAKKLHDEGRLIATPNWYYSTEFRVLYTQLIMVPLFYVINSWKWVRILTNVITYILMMLSFFFMMKPFKYNKKGVVFASTILLLPFSEEVMTHVQMGNTYMWHIILIFLLMGLLIRIVNINKETKLPFKVVYLGCFAILSIICGMSGVRYLLAFFCPAFIASFVLVLKSEAFSRLDSKVDKSNYNLLSKSMEAKYLYTAVAGCVCAVIGYLINTKIITKNYEFQTYDVTSFIPIFQGKFLERFQDTFGSLMLMFGYIEDRAMVSVRGLICVASFVILGIIAIITVNVIKKLWSKEIKAEGKTDPDHLTRYSSILFVVSFVINTFVFIFSNGTVVGRYYITVFIFFIPVFVAYLSMENRKATKSVVIACLCGCILLGSAKCAFSYIDKDKNMSNRIVAEFLKENGYSFGYAQYWNANIITELTDGQVRMANLWDVADRNEFHWSSVKDYYENKPHEGAFLLMTDEEYEEVEDKLFVNDGEIVYSDNGFVVMVFDNEEQFLNEMP